MSNQLLFILVCAVVPLKASVHATSKENKTDKKSYSLITKVVTASAVVVSVSYGLFHPVTVIFEGRQPRFVWTHTGLDQVELLRPIPRKIPWVVAWLGGMNRAS